MVINEINNALQIANEIAQEHPSRELSLTITKLEEASHWAEALRRKQAALDEQREFQPAANPRSK